MRMRVRVRAIACDVVPCETSHDVEGWMQITWERTWKHLLDKPGTQQERQESTMTADSDFSTPERGHKEADGDDDDDGGRQRAHSPSSKAPGDPRNVPEELGACAVENGDGARP